MEAAQSFPTPAPVLTAQRGGLTPSTAKMNLYELMGRFWQLNDERAFSGNETRLYFYLLNQFNTARWAAKIYRKTNQVAADLNADKKTVDTSRRGLEERGLVSYVAGNKTMSATWALGIEGKNSPLSIADRVEMQGKNSPAFTPKTPDRVEMQGKNSPLYKEEDKDVIEEEDKDTPLPPEKKMGAGDSENSSPALQAEITAPTPVAAPPAPRTEPGPQHTAETKALAAQIAALWYVTELKNFPRWARIARFVHEAQQAGQLPYLSAQFTAYRQIRQVRQISPHKLDDYLAGIWDECDWVAKAKDTRPPGAQRETPPPARSKSNPTAKQSWS